MCSVALGCHTTDAFLGTNGNYAVFIYSVIVVVLGMYVVLTLFVAILLERFADQDDFKFELENQTEKVTLRGL